MCRVTETIQSDEGLDEFLILHKSEVEEEEEETKEFAFPEMPLCNRETRVYVQCSPENWASFHRRCKEISNLYLSKYLGALYHGVGCRVEL